MSPPARQMSNLIFDKKILWVKEKRSASFVLTEVEGSFGTKLMGVCNSKCMDRISFARFALMEVEGYWEQDFWVFIIKSVWIKILFQIYANGVKRCIGNICF